ncbi:dihydrodipicolinate synthase family protein [Tropicimonas sp. IMCC34011]|uniref:dihydrodipicolinate synthase family protein n=1 Tax=Tropicimonas sp. IMCC34011 TaxID=2248759 RepID=UPI000E2472FA|nr:dihydrodipicolinate synthase family protein [Tropicimonas sp. IMCC34011]
MTSDTRTETGELHVPLITPLGPDGAPDADKLVMLAQRVMEEGADGLVLFGTLGEAQSFSVPERMAVFDALLEGGIAPDRLIVGIGAAALPDAVSLGRHAAHKGCLRQLLLPPFFFKGIGAVGLTAFFDAVIAGIGRADLRLVIYDIPGVVSVEVPQGVIADLRERHGDVIWALKDSVPDLAHVEASLSGLPGLSVFVGNEIFLPRAMELGARGAISGLGNIAPRQMKALCRPDAGGDPAYGHLTRLYDAIGKLPVVPTVKALTAHRLGDPSLAVTRAPLPTVDVSGNATLLDLMEAFVT